MKKFIMSVVSVLLAGTAFCAVTTHLSLDCRGGGRKSSTATIRLFTTFRGIRVA